MNDTKIKALAATVVVADLAVGFALGYKVAEKRLRDKYEAQLAEDIASVKATYQDMAQKEGVFSTPEGAAALLIPDEEERERIILDAGKKAFEQYASTALKDAPEQIAQALDLTQHNVFDTAAADEDLDAAGVPWDAGLPAREGDRPYIVTVDEFMESENDQLTITYYDGCGTLTDEKERILDDIDNLVGLANLNEFGRGSKDEHIVYVRNETISTDFEIVREMDTYSHAVLGIVEDEPVKPAPRKRKPKASVRDDG